MCLVVEELSQACSGIALAYAASGLGTIPIILFGSDEQKKKYLPRLAAGEILAAFGLTEAGAGSDAAAIKTTAKPDGDSYVINGTKQWITNGGEATIYTVVALTDPLRGTRGSSTILVEKGHPGFTFGKKENKMGIRASATRELVFQDCRVPKANLLGKEGHGLPRGDEDPRPVAARRGLPGAGHRAGRPGRGRQVLPRAHAVRQAHLRLPGHPVHARRHGHPGRGRARPDATRRRAASTPGRRTSRRMSAMAKVFASDTAMKVTTDAVQVLGGYGYMKEYPVEKMMRDAKITQIYEGTNQIQREVIALGLIKESVRAKKDEAPP